MNSPPWVLKWWPIVLLALATAASGVSFYVRTEAVAADVGKIQQTFAREGIVELQFTIVENRIDSLAGSILEANKRTEEQFTQVENKLDQIYRFMLNQAGRASP